MTSVFKLQAFRSLIVFGIVISANLAHPPVVSAQLACERVVSHCVQLCSSPSADALCNIIGNNDESCGAASCTYSPWQECSLTAPYKVICGYSGEGNEQ